MSTTFDSSAGVGLAGHQRVVLALVLVSYFMIVLDISIVMTGLPHIRETFGLGQIGLSWVQNAYTLFFGGFLLLGARAGDLFGRKRLFLFGLGVFTLASLAIGISETPAWLIGARAVQGVGAAALAPSVLALITTTFAEGPERTKALAYYSMVAGGGASLGLVLGGIFAQTLSWRVGFLINVPLGVILWLAAHRLLEETERHTGQMDVPGAVISTLGMGTLVFAIVHSATNGWGDSLTLAALVLAVALLASFVWHEQRSARPMLPLGLFADRERAGAYLARMLFIGSIVGFFFFCSQFMQETMGYTALEAGLAFLPMTIPTFIAAIAVPRLTERYSNGLVMTLSFALLALGMIWLSRLDAESGFFVGIALPMLLIGLGNGGGLGPLTVSGVSNVAPARHGAASGLVSVAHQMGGTLGLAILVSVFSAAQPAGVDGTALIAHQTEAALTGASVMLVFGFVVALMVIWPAKRRAA